MKKAYILAAGTGEKIWPYGELRNKAMIPVANKPVIAYTVEGLLEAGVTEIVIGAAKGVAEIKKTYRGNEAVTVFETGNTSGTAATIRRIIELEKNGNEEGFFIFYGDVLLKPEDLLLFWNDVERQLQNSKEDMRLLLSPIKEEENGDHVCCSVKDGKLREVLGHPRGGASHRFAGFFVPPGFADYINNCGDIFHNIEVGMMPPVEQYLELAVSDFKKDGGIVYYSETKEKNFDLDKPWHILMANDHMCEYLTDTLTENVLAEGASIDESAKITGFVKLGKNSSIGRNVTIGGNLIVGDNTKIDNGAIFGGSSVIGDNCHIANFCFIEGETVIGNNCVINHCAEICGTIFDTVYLYHYMEIYGLLGEGTDIGAATVCGSLRFDDGITIHKIRGRKEFPRSFSEASYIGDFCRTGVNAIIMPGCKMGPYSILGSGVLLEEDLPSRTSIRVKQELIKGKWGPERYGW